MKCAHANSQDDQIYTAYDSASVSASKQVKHGNAWNDGKLVTLRMMKMERWWRQGKKGMALASIPSGSAGGIGLGQSMVVVVQ